MAIMTLERRNGRRVSRAQPTVIDLFAGCGGLSLGLEEAGFQPVFVNELDEDAMATYLANRLKRFPALARFRAFDIHDITGNGNGRSGCLAGLSSELRQAYGDIDLVAGGPPCQGYSGIGHRRTFTGLAKAEIPSNHLYRDMAKFIRSVRPKMFLFENVKGLLFSRWRRDGDIGEIWRDVRQTFADIDGYDVRDAVVLAKDYGVPQNRPRVLIVGVRRDLGFNPRLDSPANGLLPNPAGLPPDPLDVLGDLLDETYEGKRATTEYPRKPTALTTWFRTDPETGHVAAAGDPLTEHEYSQHKANIVSKFRYMLDNNGAIREQDQTKKFAQRVMPERWGPQGPTMTTTTLPDDYVHFRQPRILTVREWARMQTFPDWYQFAGKRTTGGRRRAGDPVAGDWSREVPKYTQIGNAVPVWLARAIGTHLRTILSDA